jgi:nucleoside recognition membrane protein YjiH
MPAYSLPFLLYETLEVGEARDGVPDLMHMVPVRWLVIVCLYGISLTMVSTQYASTTSMYMSHILWSLQKLLCYFSVVLCVSFLLC